MAAPHLSVRLVLGFGEDLPDSVISLNEAILGYGPSRHAIEAPPRTGPALINTRLLSLGTGAFLFGLYCSAISLPSCSAPREATGRDLRDQIMAQV